MFWTGKKNAKNKKRVKAGNAAGQLVAWGVLAVVIAFYEFMFMGILVEEQATALFPPMVAMFAMLMTLLTTVSYAKVLLFEAKDHDLLFSLPVSGKMIVASKLAVMYTLDSILNLVMLIPCGIMYGIFAKPNFIFYICYTVMILFTTMIPILFAAIISAGFSFLASRFRHAQFITVILYVIFLGGVMAVSFSAGMAEGAEETMLISPVLEEFLVKAGTYYPPITWFREGAMEGKLSSILLFVGTSLLAFSVVALFFGKFYGKIHEAFRPKVVRRQYKSSEKTSSIFMTLIKKDAKRIFSSAGILMNQLVGLLMLIVFAVMFSALNLGMEGDEMKDVFSIMFPFIFAMAAAMVNDTATAISLEGRAFPLLKSLPVTAKTILDAKLALHMVFCAPVIVICGLVVSLANELPILGMIATVVIPLCYAYISGVTGLLINLKKYKFDWTSEIMVAKNNLPMLITMFGGIVLSIVPMVIAIFLFMLMESLAFVLGIFITLSVIFAIVASLIMNTVGEKWFAEIEY